MENDNEEQMVLVGHTGPCAVIDMKDGKALPYSPIGEGTLADGTKFKLGVANNFSAAYVIIEKELMDANGRPMVEAAFAAPLKSVFDDTVMLVGQYRENQKRN